MSKKMLIDAAHSEEIRVAVVNQNRVEDYEFESLSRKPLRGNIYLARVIRVEPSLQAAFVEYGGNRHGFLGFSEIHPDYYQIPVADREKLQTAQMAVADLAAKLELVRRGEEEGGDAPAKDSVRESPEDERDALLADPDESAARGTDRDAGDAPLPVGLPEDISTGIIAGEVQAAPVLPEESGAGSAVADADDEEPSSGDTEAGPDASDGQSGAPAYKELVNQYREARRALSKLLRNYRIQEVIKRRQILLAQVVKDERGNKGAALTTYLSLAGRYCVLMPNTARGGGISRKIASASDRRRLYRVVDSLEVPRGMGLIIRTAGARRTKAEICRDFGYLLRLWESIRTLTLESIAPCLIYEEASLIKRAIRDLYEKDIGRIIVEGEAGYRELGDFMKMLMPSHVKNVHLHKGRVPVFLKYGVESMLDGIYEPTVQLGSGGYIVIHQTEALVAVDVNSGKSTKERNIESTALKTNFEAAQEVARQLRLRDLAGLIVIDFIDMEDPHSNRQVEKALRDAVKADRARIQMGRISSFGLLEMSRQRRRSGIVDGTTHTCPSCGGAGVIRSPRVSALRILRALEGEAVAGKAARFTVHTSPDTGLYLLNRHRRWLQRIEDGTGVTVEVATDSGKAGDAFEIEKSGEPDALSVPDAGQAIQPDTIDVHAGEQAGTDAEPEPERKAAGSRRPGRRRRAPRPSSDRKGQDGAGPDDKTENGTDIAADAKNEEAGGEDRPRRRRRGRRGGRRQNRVNGHEDGIRDFGSRRNPFVREKETDAPDAAASSGQSLAAAPACGAKADTPQENVTPIRPEDTSGNAHGTHTTERNAEVSPDTPSVPERKKAARKGWWHRVTGA